MVSCAPFSSWRRAGGTAHSVPTILLQIMTNSFHRDTALEVQLRPRAPLIVSCRIGALDRREQRRVSLANRILQWLFF